MITSKMHDYLSPEVQNLSSIFPWVLTVVVLLIDPKEQVVNEHIKVNREDVGSLELWGHGLEGNGDRNDSKHA